MFKSFKTCVFFKTVINNVPPVRHPGVVSAAVVQAVPISEQPVHGYNARGSFGLEAPEGASVFGQTDYTQNTGLYLPNLDNVVQPTSVTKIG